MKLNKTTKKILAVVMSLAMIVTSITISRSAAMADETGLSITDITWTKAGGINTFTVNFTPVSSETQGDADPYLYCIYIDQIDSEHSAINYSDEWNWKSNFEWLNPVGGFNNGYYFNGAFTTAADFATNGKAGTYLKDEAAHKVIIAAYSSLTDANADTNAVATAEATLDIPEETTAAEGETIAVGTITYGTPTISTEKGETFRHVSVSWSEVLNAASYTTYVGTEDTENVAKAYHNNWAFENRTQKSVDHIKAECGTTLTLITVAYNADGAIIARGNIDIEIPAMSDTELAEADKIAKFTTSDNLAAEGSAFAYANNPSSIIDKNLSTRWQGTALTEPSDGYFGVDLGSVKSISAVMISWEASFASAYDIYVAGADEVYGSTPVASATVSNSAMIVSSNFDTVEAQYVKIVPTELSNNAKSYGVSVFEIGIFAEAFAQIQPQETTTSTSGKPSMMQMTSITADNDWHENGAYWYYVGAWNSSTAQMAVDPLDSTHIQIQQLTSNWWDAYAVQIKLFAAELTANATYTLKIDMWSSSADGKVKVSNNDAEIPCVDGKQTLTIIVTANNEGIAEFVVGMGYVGLSTVLDFSNPILMDAQGSKLDIVLYKPTEEPTTATEEPTTAAEELTTATEEPTTVIEGSTTVVAEPTTVADTDNNAVKKVTAPAKAKIKKITAKKKTAKKVKLAIKKTTDAVGYQVAIYKTKKNAKNNKKAVVKKLTKKLKVTVTSKKLKNKTKLFVKVRAYVLDASGNKVYGKWSAVKKIKIK